MRALGATPVKPVPGTAEAAITPARNVPCPTQSVAAVPLAWTRPASPAACGDTPVSTTATFTPAPCVYRADCVRLRLSDAHGVAATWMCDAFVQVSVSGLSEEGINGSSGPVDADAEGVAVASAAEAPTAGTTASTAPRSGASTVRRGAPGPCAGRVP